MKRQLSNWIWSLAGVLLCLTLFSFHLTAGLYARYTTTGTGSDSARVAKFNVVQSGDILTQGLAVSTAPGGTEGCEIVVENSSEVAVGYSITVTNHTNNLPLEFAVEKGSTTLTKDDNGAYQGDMAVGETATYTLQILWPKNMNNPEAYMGKVDWVEITLTAAQID